MLLLGKEQSSTPCLALPLRARFASVCPASLHTRGPDDQQAQLVPRVHARFRPDSDASEESGAGRDHRCGWVVDGVDDVGVVMPAGRSTLWRGWRCRAEEEAGSAFTFPNCEWLSATRTTSRDSSQLKTRWHVGTRTRRDACRAQVWPLDVVRVPADRRARTERDIAQVRDCVAGGSRRLSAARAPWAATDRVRANPRGVSHAERDRDLWIRRRKEASVMHDALHARCTWRATVRQRPGALLRRSSGSQHRPTPSIAG